MCAAARRRPAYQNKGCSPLFTSLIDDCEPLITDDCCENIQESKFLTLLCEEYQSGRPALEQCRLQYEKFQIPSREVAMTKA